MTQSKDVGRTVSTTANPQQLQLFNPNRVTALKGMRVFDVGQGDCIGLRDQKNNVFCYVDYGGLGDHPDKANPSHTASRMPVKQGNAFVSIILTHWDKDHYWSAVKKNQAAKKCLWLVPRQHASPQAVLFAGQLNNARCWPESIGQQAHSFRVNADTDVEIRKCDKFNAQAVTEDRNKTGLAIALVRRNRTAGNAMMILSGDCAFDLVPNLPSVPIRAIVAYHHGSSTHWTSSTANAISSSCSSYRMVYSFGQNNGFGHPKRANYKNCTPHWDAHAATTPNVRANSSEFTNVDW